MYFLHLKCPITTRLIIQASQNTLDLLFLTRIVLAFEIVPKDAGNRLIKKSCNAPPQLTHHVKTRATRLTINEFYKDLALRNGQIFDFPIEHTFNLFLTGTYQAPLLPSIARHRYISMELFIPFLCKARIRKYSHDVMTKPQILSLRFRTTEHLWTRDPNFPNQHPRHPFFFNL